MMEYSINVTEEKYYIRSLFRFMCSFEIIISGICFPLSVYFFIVGFLFDKEMLKSSFPLLLIVIIMIAVMLKKYSHIKKLITTRNKAYNDNGEIKYLLSKENNLIKIKCVNNGIIGSYLKEDIKKIKYYKKVIIISTRYRGIYMFPNDNQIISFLGI